MKTSILAAALVAGVAAKDASHGKAPLINSGWVSTFLKESVLLTRDLSIFAVATGANNAWAFVPAEQQKLISDHYSQAMDQIETLRLQNGIMKPSDAWKEVTGQWEGKVKPAIGKAYDVVTKAAEKPFTFIKTFISNFEAEYPEHAGLLSKVSIWDCLLTLFFIVYFVLGYSKRAFCYVFCCGACRKRASAGSPQLIKKQSPPIKTNGISKKR